jgi:hypothetical protein
LSVPLQLAHIGCQVLEEKYGFNKTSPGLFVADLLKGWAIGGVLITPFLWAFLRIFNWAGDRFVPWLMAFVYVPLNFPVPVSHPRPLALLSR